MDYHFHSLSPLVCDNLRPLTLSLPVKVGFRFPPLYSLSPTASEVHWCFCYLSFLVHHCLTRFPPLITFRFHHTHFLSLLFQMHVCCCLYHVYTLLCFCSSPQVHFSRNCHLVRNGLKRDKLDFHCLSILSQGKANFSVSLCSLSTQKADVSLRVTNWFF